MVYRFVTDRESFRAYPLGLSFLVDLSTSPFCEKYENDAFSNKSKARLSGYPELRLNRQNYQVYVYKFNVIYSEDFQCQDQIILNQKLKTQS
jgi:hypothetical protein